MHYIAGTKVVISGRSSTGGRIRPGMTSQQVRALKSNVVDGDMLSKFKQGKEYTLTRIYKNQNEKFVYKFIGTGDIVEVEFSLISQAENFISGLRGEDLPDYNTAYRDATD